uniref:Spectrin repeats metazoan domain-containing protein n=1 Tax=Caenorhabditis japonica TaxID=281687 RepID=A0A8R1EP80_CAEJA
IGTTYEQVHKFGKDLEGSFDALQVLLENNQEYTNEKVSAQIANVFQMILETLSQEKHQADKFISNAQQIGKSDEWLNIQRAQEAVRNMITDHENRFKYVQHKWNEWQRDKVSN